jgi:hypothetical protein
LIRLSSSPSTAAESTGNSAKQRAIVSAGCTATILLRSTLIVRRFRSLCKGSVRPSSAPGAIAGWRAATSGRPWAIQSRVASQNGLPASAQSVSNAAEARR